MARWYILLPVLVSWATGSPLEITSASEINKIQYKVDISQCTQLRFGMKTCSGVHIWLGDGTAAGTYEIFMAGRKFNMTGFSDCGLNLCPNTTVTFPTPGLLNCDEYRKFWVSWDNGIAFGTGNIPHAGVLFNDPGPLVHDIHVLGHFVDDNISATIKLGDDNDSLFELAGKDIKYNSTLLTDVDNNEAYDCGLLCHEHPECGRFSYNHTQKKCHLFAPDLSTFPVTTSESGWDSWRMIYCN